MHTQMKGWCQRQHIQMHIYTLYKKKRKKEKRKKQIYQLCALGHMHTEYS